MPSRSMYMCVFGWPNSFTSSFFLLLFELLCSYQSIFVHLESPEIIPCDLSYDVSICTSTLHKQILTRVTKLFHSLLCWQMRYRLAVSVRWVRIHLLFGVLPPTVPDCEFRAVKMGCALIVCIYYYYGYDLKLKLIWYDLVFLHHVPIHLNFSITIAAWWANI